MKTLKFHDRCEQGTPKGVMLFQKKSYAVEGPNEAGEFLVSHEPRIEQRRDPATKKRGPVAVLETVVGADVLEKLLAFGPCKFEE